LPELRHELFSALLVADPAAVPRNDTHLHFQDAGIQSLPAIPGYALSRRIAIGGQAEVYEGVQDSTGQRVAIKIGRRDRSAQRDVSRILMEARRASRLQHPSVVRYIDCGLSDSRPFLVMDFVPGLTLDEHIVWKGLAMPQRVRLMVQVCRAVAYVHERGLIHGDLKPANILMDEQENPILIDFGLSRALGGVSSRCISGTKRYMAPERIELTTVNRQEVRCEVYSLGVIMSELLLLDWSQESEGNEQATRAPPIVRLNERTHGVQAHPMGAGRCVARPKPRLPSWMQSSPRRPTKIPNVVTKPRTHWPTICSGPSTGIPFKPCRLGCRDVCSN